MQAQALLRRSGTVVRGAADGYRGTQQRTLAPCLLVTALASPRQCVKIGNHSVSTTCVGSKAGRSRIAAAAPTASAATAATKQVVVLTREKGKNGELMRMLDERSVAWVEMPLVEAAGGPDRDLLPSALLEEEYDWVALTSPESAAVFLEGWRKAGRPQVRIATVGKGTSRILREAPEADELSIEFEPTKANAVHFSAELPHIPGGSDRILYPASVKAATTLQTGFEARGFHVKRLNTYNTLAVDNLGEEQLQAAAAAAVVTFASPSAVRAWVLLVGAKSDAAVVCIGSTSARAAEGSGLSPVFYPEAPGVEGFVDSIMDALRSRETAHA